MSEPAPRFTVLDSAGNQLTADAASWATIHDAQTNLTWYRSQELLLTDSAAKALAASEGQRLPTLAELESLRDISKFKPAIAAEFASDTFTDQPYRTSDDGAEGSEDVAWMVDFTYGFASIGSKTFPLRVRFVKDAA